MNQVNYEMNLKDINEHKLQILKRGACPSILKGSFYIEQDICHVTIDVCGLFHLKTFLNEKGVEHKRFESSVQLYRETLGWLRKIVESALLAGDYLIDKNMFSMLLEDLYFESKKGRACLILKPSEESFFQRLCTLCNDIYTNCPASNADVLRGRLEEQNAKAVLSLQDILRLLSSWEYELS